MICPITDKPCRTNGCGEKCYKRDSLGYNTSPQHDAKLPVMRCGSCLFAQGGDEFGDVVWNANFIEPERFKELAKKYWSIAAFL